MFWYLNDDLIREIPDSECDEVEDIPNNEMVSDELLVDEDNIDSSSNSDEEGSGFILGKVNLLCHVDPTQLTLADVTRDLQGNFTCVGRNIVGEGNSSEPEELIVHCKYLVVIS